MDNLITIVELIARLEVYLGQFFTLVVVIAQATGFVAVVIGVRSAGRRAEQGTGGGGWAGPISWIFSGIFLLSLPYTLSVLSRSVIRDGWSQVSAEIFTTAPDLLDALDGDVAEATVVGILRIVQFLGVIAIFRGILLLNASCQPGQQPTVGAGLTFIAGGTLALNIGSVLGALNELVVA